MLRVCSASGCNAPAYTTYGRYCRAHVAQLRRHGGIGQTAISKADLKPYLGMVQRRLELNSDRPVMAQLEARWTGLKGFADGILAESRTGMAMNKHQREAASEIVRLCQWVRPREAVETVLAIYLMQDSEPHRFVSDAAFWAQMVRRVRGLTEKNADTWMDRATGKQKRVYRDLSQLTVQCMAGWIVETLGSAGVMFARLEREEHERQKADLLEYKSALQGLR